MNANNDFKQSKMEGKEHGKIYSFVFSMNAAADV